MGLLCPGGTAENSPTFSTLGGEFRIARVPKGRLNEQHVLRELMGMNFGRPFGTWSIRGLIPTLKRWAIVVRSLRDSRSGSNCDSTKQCPAGLATTWLVFSHA